jgi:hypothetical protein
MRADGGARSFENMWRVAAAALPGAVLLLAVNAGLAEQRKPDPGDPKPAVRIPLDPLGFAAQGSFYLTYRLSSASLGFLDHDHLLFTFRPQGLMKRTPGDEDGDEDQDIRAVVLEIATGKVERKVEWRMHDRSRYMWPLAEGKFLIRMRNELFVTDSSLELEPYLKFSTTLRAVQVSPDRKLLALETDAHVEEQPEMSGEESKPIPVKKINILIVEARSNVALAKSEVRSPITLPLVPGALLDALEGNKAGMWAIRDVSFKGESKVVGEVKSSCQPTLTPVSAQVVLVIGCFQGLGDQQAVGLSMDGRALWQQRWESRYIWPTMDFAENGSRFAYATLDTGHPIGTMTPFDSGDVRGQLVGVFDTVTGKSELVKDASPVMSAGQNYALSADGTRFAILREGAIEIYDLPPAPVMPAAPAEKSAAKK